MSFLQSSDGLIFVAMVGLAVFFLVISLAVPAFGPERQAAKRLRHRIGQVIDEFETPHAASLLREKYLRNLSPVERWLESLPGLGALGRVLQQAGSPYPAYRLLLMCVGVGITVFLLFSVGLDQPLIAPVFGFVAAPIPIVMMIVRRNKRLERFDEQLPEALDVINRALRAGHPFSESLRLVAEEMEDPISTEFGSTFADINYGADIRGAFISLLERAPSMSMMAVVTAVLIQRESGGNLAEVLEKNAAIVRSRFRFQRRVRTLSAEGRFSAWVLAMVPFVLTLLIHFTTPTYLPVLIEHPTGRGIIVGAFVFMMIGVYWLRRILRIDV